MHSSISLTQPTRLNRLCSLRGRPCFGFGFHEQRGRGRRRRCGAEFINPGAGDWRDVDGDRRPWHSTLAPHGDLAAERPGAGGRRRRQQWRLSKRATLSSCDWKVAAHRRHESFARRSHGDVAAERAGVGGRRRRLQQRRPRSLWPLGTIRSDHQDVEGHRQPPQGTLGPYGDVADSRDFASAELYDPATGVWTATGSMATPRFNHTATLLPNGQVLVAGGFEFGVGTLAGAELYDPATGMWRATGSMNTPRWVHTATLLPNGQVLVAGGIVELFSTYTASAELYDPATGVWTATGSMTTKRGVQTATLLPNGQVLVAGGRDGDTFFTSAELYDSATGMWTATGSMATPRFVHTATLLPDGQVLVAGGDNFTDGFLASAELYQSAPAVFDIQ